MPLFFWINPQLYVHRSRESSLFEYGGHSKALDSNFPHNTQNPLRVAERMPKVAERILNHRQ